jgi:hypothetical protein
MSTWSHPMSSPAVVPAGDYPQQVWIHPKTFETVSTNIIAFEIEGGAASPIRWPSVPKGYEEVVFNGSHYLYGGHCERTTSQLIAVLREARHG